ncbi:MAG: hypothetical protein R3E82_00550 [Pseudomonadales bacterium]|nr:hypothetical protein [Pseudomonadales bacterium]
MYVTSHQRHNQAMLAPSRKDEKAIVGVLRGLQDYHELLSSDEGQRPGTAAIQGMSDIARGLHRLIQQGPLGRLDRGLIEAALEPFIIEGPASTLSLVPDAAGTEPATAEAPAEVHAFGARRRNAQPA